MAFEIYDASVPIFVNSLKNMRAWLERAGAEKSEADMMEAKLAPDMRPLPAQYQMACDTAKNALARLSGTDAPAVTRTRLARTKALPLDWNDQRRMFGFA